MHRLLLQEARSRSLIVRSFVAPLSLHTLQLASSSSLFSCGLDLRSDGRQSLRQRYRERSEYFHLIQAARERTFAEAFGILQNVRERREAERQAELAAMIEQTGFKLLKVSAFGEGWRGAGGFLRKSLFWMAESFFFFVVDGVYPRASERITYSPTRMVFLMHRCS